MISGMPCTLGQLDTDLVSGTKTKAQTPAKIDQMAKKMNAPYPLVPETRGGVIRPYRLPSLLAYNDRFQEGG